MIRIAGFIASLLAYLYLAAGLFLQIMMGDCASDPVEHARCEAARSNWLLGLAFVTVLALAGLIWAFFLRGRTHKGGNQ